MIFLFQKKIIKNCSCSRLIFRDDLIFFLVKFFFVVMRKANFIDSSFESRF